MTNWRSIAVGIVTVWVGAGLAGLQSATTTAPAALSENTLIYILAHDSREAAKKNWAAFSTDPVRKQVWADTEKDGPINMKVESVYLNPTDFSPIK